MFGNFWEMVGAEWRRDEEREMDERQQGEEFTSDHVWTDLLLSSLAGNNSGTKTLHKTVRSVTSDTELL